MAVKGAERVQCHAAEGGLSTSSEMVPDLVDGKIIDAMSNAVQEPERATCYIREGNFASPSEMVPEIVESMLEKR